MSEEEKEPSELHAVLVEESEVEFLREVRVERYGRMVVRVSTVHHGAIGFMLLVRVTVDGGAEMGGVEIASCQAFLAGIVDWIEQYGDQILSEEAKRHMPEWRPRFDPSWDA